MRNFIDNFADQEAHPFALPEQIGDLSFSVEIDRIPASGGQYEVSATPEQCAAAANRLGAAEVKTLTAQFTVRLGARGLGQASRSSGASEIAKRR